MVRGLRRSSSVDEVVDAIKAGAAEIRAESARVAESHRKMDAIAAHLEELVERVRGKEGE